MAEVEGKPFIEHLNKQSLAAVNKLRARLNPNGKVPTKTDLKEFQEGIDKYPYSQKKKFEGAEKKTLDREEVHNVKPRDILRRVWTGKYSPYEKDKRERREFTKQGVRPKRHSRSDPGRDSSWVSYKKGLHDRRIDEKRYVGEQIVQGKKDFTDQKSEGILSVKTDYSRNDDWKKYREEGYPLSEQSLNSNNTTPLSSREKKQARRERSFGKGRGRTPVF